MIKVWVMGFSYLDFILNWSLIPRTLVDLTFSFSSAGKNSVISWLYLSCLNMSCTTPRACRGGSWWRSSLSPPGRSSQSPTGGRSSQSQTGRSSQSQTGRSSQSQTGRRHCCCHILLIPDHPLSSSNISHAPGQSSMFEKIFQESNRSA